MSSENQPDSRCPNGDWPNRISSEVRFVYSFLVTSCFFNSSIFGQFYTDTMELALKKEGAASAVKDETIGMSHVGAAA